MIDTSSKAVEEGKSGEESVPEAAKVDSQGLTEADKVAIEA